MRKTPKIKFVNLHGHSCASTFDGLGYPQDHMDFAYENGLDALAITDHGNMNNLPYQVFHAQKMDKEGKEFKAVFGVEAYFIPSLKEWEEEYSKSKKKKKEEGSATVVEDEAASRAKKTILNRRRHMVLLAKNQVGLENIYQMISESFQKPYMYRFPRIDYDLLRKHSEGIIATSACLGGVYAGDYWENKEDGPEAVLSAMRETTKNMLEIFGDDWYGEIQWNMVPEQHELNQFVIQVCQEFDVELVSTADAHFPRPELWQSREMYKAIGWRGKDAVELPQSAEEMDYLLYPKNGDEMWAAYKEACEELSLEYDDNIVLDSIQRTHDIVHTKIEKFYPDNTVRLPSFVVPEGKTADETLREKAHEALGAAAVLPEYYDRLEKELEVISSRGFSKYFLTMAAVSDEASKRMLTGPGRGSACGSLLAYVLGITQVDPIKWETQFERFLRADATDYPDIDYDVSDAFGLKDFLIEKWGKYCVVPISNWNTLQIRSLLKDISKFYDIPFQEVNAVTSKMIAEATPKAKAANGIKSGLYVPTYEEVKLYSPSLQKYLEKYSDIAKHVDALLGMPRSCSRHAGGVVIADDINKYMPLICSKGVIQTPWTEGQNVRHLEPMGFIKFDVLGLGTLRIIENAIESILRRKGKKDISFEDVKAFYDKHLHPDIIDFKDKKVYDSVFRRGHYPGIFQMDSDGIQALAKKVDPENLIDIATISSIYRPGPLGADVDKDYVDARNNPTSISYPHEVYEEVTAETFGFCIFQEQIAMLAHKLGKDISLDEGNLLRKVLTKKGTGKEDQVKNRLHDKFIQGCLEKDISKSVATKMWSTFEYFSGYGFNKSHAVAYSMITYQCAWLYTYYPSEWMAAFLNEQPEGNKESAIALAKQFGFKVKPPSINFSTDKWEISKDGKTLFQPLTDIKGLGKAAYDQLIPQRPFDTIEDILFNKDIVRAKVNKKILDKLCRSKALDELIDDRFSGDKHFWTAVSVFRPEKEEELEENIENPIMRQERSFSLAETVSNLTDLTNVFPIDLMVSPELQDDLITAGVYPIGNYDKDIGFVWCIPRAKMDRKTAKSKKLYWVLDVVDSTFTITRIKVWGVRPHDKIELNRPYVVANLEYDEQWGFSTPWGKSFNECFSLIG